MSCSHSMRTWLNVKNHPLLRDHYPVDAPKPWLREKEEAESTIKTPDFTVHLAWSRNQCRLPCQTSNKQLRNLQFSQTNSESCKLRTPWVWNAHVLEMPGSQSCENLLNDTDNDGRMLICNANSDASESPHFCLDMIEGSILNCIDALGMSWNRQYLNELWEIWLYKYYVESLFELNAVKLKHDLQKNIRQHVRVVSAKNRDDFVLLRCLFPRLKKLHFIERRICWL